jgi:hypothetical protein
MTAQSESSASNECSFLNVMKREVCRCDLGGWHSAGVLEEELLFE